MALKGVTPYPPEFAKRYREEGYWKDRSLGDVFDETFQKFADRIAIVAGDQRITYLQLAERTERLALHLLKLGLKPLDTVVVQLPNVPEFIYLYFALQKVGAIPLMALPAHRYLEISTFVQQTGAVGYAIPRQLGDTNLLELAERVQGEQPSLKHILVLGEEVPAPFHAINRMVETESGLKPAALADVRIDPTDPACFQLSGGTTGLPKIIPRTHNDYVLNSEASGAVNDIRPDDALLVVLPVAHNFPLASPGLQAFFLQGARVVLSTSVQTKEVLPLVERERVTHIELVPALLIRWNNDPLVPSHDLSSVRIINTGGQKLQPEVKRRTESLIPSCKVQEVFGMAEGLLMLVRLDDQDDVRLETAGRPVCPADEAFLADEHGKPVPQGEIGELYCRGPYTLRGYFRADAHNASSFTHDGFFKTGDLLRLHPSGNFVVEGRRKDLINRGGEKISAEEVENLLLSHPAVQNVACVPMPDPVLGERMCAYVVARPGTTPTLAVLTGYALEKGMAKYKLPERLEMLSELPTSGFGKVSKKTLAEWITTKLKEEGVV